MRIMQIVGEILLVVGLGLVIDAIPAMMIGLGITWLVAGNKEK